jgi:S-adenosylmethionine hydrolase
MTLASIYFPGGGKLFTLIDSSENLEIAAKDASAAKLLGAKIGDKVQITILPPH